MSTRRLIGFLVAIAVIGFILGYMFVTSPDAVGGSSTQTYTGPIRTTSLVLVSQKAWKRKGAIRKIGHHAHRTNLKAKRRSSSAATMSGALSGPCYRVDAEVHGDSRLIDKVVQGWLHAKICMKPGDHTKIMDKYSGASSSHKETWLWWVGTVDEVKGAGVSTTWCLDPGEQGPCQAVEYRYWRYTFQWKQGVSVFGQDLAHHKTLYVGCTLRAGQGGYQCGTGEA